MSHSDVSATVTATDDFTPFISSASVKTPPMDVRVTDGEDKLIRSYSAPSGFHLGRYCRSLEKVDDIEESYDRPNDCLIVKCYNKSNELLEIHKGTYTRRHSWE